MGGDNDTGGGDDTKGGDESGGGNDTGLGGLLTERGNNGEGGRGMFSDASLYDGRNRYVGCVRMF